LHNFETFFSAHLRDKEKNFLIRIGRLQALILGIIPIAPTFVAVLTLLVHTGIGYPLTAAEVSISLIAMITLYSLIFAIQ